MPPGGTSRWVAIPFLLSAGCLTGPGQGDLESALELVYAEDGVPAFAGQAVAIQSCGAGGFCHAEGIEPAERFGAPAGLDFDMRVASTTVEVEEDAAFRLLAHRQNLLNNPGLVWGAVSSLRMPPGGAVGAMYRSETLELHAYDRFDESGVLRGPLPGIDDEEGREIFRNWLAVGAPVVERTQPRIDRRPNVNDYHFTVRACERGCVDPTWESIYVQIIRPSCARSRCHSDIVTDPEEGLDLGADLSVPAGQSHLTREQLVERTGPVLARIRSAEAQGSRCRPNGHVYLTPGSPQESLLYLKVSPARSIATATSCSTAADCEGVTPPAECRDTDGDSRWTCEGVCVFVCDVCGRSMPLAGSALSEQRLCAIREWIACGACGTIESPCEDGDACTEAARATCGVGAAFDVERGSAECIERESCVNRLEL